MSTETQPTDAEPRRLTFPWRAITAYLFGGFAVLMGFALMWESPGVFAGVILTTTGVVTMPGGYRKVAERLNVEFSTGLRVAIYVMGWLVSRIFVNIYP